MDFPVVSSGEFEAGSRLSSELRAAEAISAGAAPPATERAGVAPPRSSGPADVRRYRPDIDGLRAIAVLSVVGYHAFPARFRGGYIGVDIFFVISGYLISGIILDGLSNQRFNFKDFYTRRVKRIFPALFLVLAACLGAGWFLLMPGEYKQLGKHVMAGAGFASNFVLRNELAYFDTKASLKPLLHLWSLAIEEQFYVVWPILLFLVWKSRTALRKLLVTILFWSFLLNLYYAWTDVASAFYLPFTRFWELTIGSGLAYVTLFEQHRLDISGLRRRRNETAGAGMVLIGIALAVLGPNSRFPGFWAVLPTVGAALLILAGAEAWISRSFLSRRAIVFVGLVSFPFYLWHWPMLVFTRLIQSGTPSASMRIAAVIGSFALASLTYFFVEKPVRSGAFGFAQAGRLATLLLGAGCAGYFVFAHDGLRSRVPLMVANAVDQKSADLIAGYVNLDYDFRSDARIGSCWLDFDERPDAYSDGCVDARRTVTDNRPVILVWGDSHAGRLFPGIRRTFGREFRLAEYTRDSCPPVLELGYDECRQTNAFVIRKIGQVKPETVVMYGVWTSYSTFLPDSEGAEKLTRTISELKRSGVRHVIVIGPAPQWTIDLPRNLLNLYWRDHIVPVRTRFGLAWRRVAPIDSRFRDLVKNGDDVTYVSALDAFCNAAGCLTRADSTPTGITTWDYGHLTTAGAEYLARRLPITGPAAQR